MKLKGAETYRYPQHIEGEVGFWFFMSEKAWDHLKDLEKARNQPLDKLLEDLILQARPVTESGARDALYIQRLAQENELLHCRIASVQSLVKGWDPRLGEDEQP